MPSSLQAVMTRTAISPRLAISIFLKRTDGKQSLPVLHRLTVENEPALDDARVIGLDLVHELHRFDDAEDVTGLDALTDRDKRGGPRRGGFVESADDRRLDEDEVGVGGLLGLVAAGLDRRLRQS